MRALPLALVAATLLAAGCGKKTPETPPSATGSGPNGGPMLPPPPAPPTAKPAAARGDAGRGKVVYAANCQGCHTPTGKGKMADQPDFTNAAWQAKEDDEELLNAIRKGHDKMPAFEGRLSNQEIVDVLAYVRTLPKGTTK